MLKRRTVFQTCLFLLLVILLFQAMPLYDVSAQVAQVIPITPSPMTTPGTIPQYQSGQPPQQEQSQQYQAGICTCPPGMIPVLPVPGQYPAQPVQSQYPGQSLQGQYLAQPVPGQYLSQSVPNQCICQPSTSQTGQVTQPVQLQPQLQLQQLPPSFIEDYIAGTLPLMAPSIRQFGYDLFAKVPSSFVPPSNVPVGPDYVVGPGDEIRISVWGKIEGFWSAVVDKDGAISLPKVGTIGVTGLTFKELKDVLRKEISKYYTGFEMNVSMGQLRTMRVYIVGNAAKPGVYNLSSFSTLVSALFEVGGPSKTGSLRDIQLKRNGKKVVHFDFYDFLLKGDKSKDVRLLPEDVLFIPPVGPLAGISGSLKTPAIYELKDGVTVSQLIEMAGGLSDVAFTGRVQIERIVGNGRQTVFESDVSAARDLPVMAGDVVRVYTAVQDKRFVKITGAVLNVGAYGYRQGMTVRDLISIAGGLQYYAYTKEAEITRVRVTDQGPVTDLVAINLEKALAGDADNNIQLFDNDYLFIRPVPEWDLYKTVTIQGEVKFPGTYTIHREETISSVIERAGGFTPYVYLRGAVFTRESVKLLQQQQLDEMVDRLQRELLSSSISDVTTAANSDEANLLRMENGQKAAFLEKLRTLRAKGRIAIRLSQDMASFKSSPNDITLNEGDVIQIPSNPKTVQVLGSVYNQSAFVYDKSKDISDYIDRAGGYTDNADSKGTYILMADGTATKVGSGFLGITWNSGSNRWDSGGSGVGPGDTIIVPEQLEKIAWMRNIKDITQILYQIAVGAAVVIQLFP